MKQKHPEVPGFEVLSWGMWRRPVLLNFFRLLVECLSNSVEERAQPVCASKPQEHLFLLGGAADVKDDVLRMP